MVRPNSLPPCPIPVRSPLPSPLPSSPPNQINHVSTWIASSQTTIRQGTATPNTTTNHLPHPNQDHLVLNPSALPFSPTPTIPCNPSSLNHPTRSATPVTTPPVSGVERPSTSSWSSITTSRGSIPSHRKLSFIVPARINSTWVATCKSDEIAKASTRLEDFLQGILIGKKPYIPVLKKVLVSKWKLEGSLDLVPLEDGSLLFKFGRSEEKQKVLDAGPHFVAGHALALRPWRRAMAQGSSVLNAIPVWIQLPNLPLEFWSMDSLSRIGSTLGTPLFVDEHTANLTRLGFPRICVEISPISELPDDVLIRVEGGESFRQKLRFEWKPKICTRCRSFFHSNSSCPKEVGVGVSGVQVRQHAPTTILNHEVVEKNGWTVVKPRNRRKMNINKADPTHRNPPIRPLVSQSGNLKQGGPNQSDSGRNKQAIVISPECSTQETSDGNQGVNGSPVAGNLTITLSPTKHCVNGGTASEFQGIDESRDAVQAEILGEKAEGTSIVGSTSLQPLEADDIVEGAASVDRDDLVGTPLADDGDPVSCPKEKQMVTDWPFNDGIEMHAESLGSKRDRSVGETFGDCPNAQILNPLTLSNRSANLPFDHFFNPSINSSPNPPLNPSSPPSSQTQNHAMPILIPAVAQNPPLTLPISNPSQAIPTLGENFDGSSADGDRPFPPGFTPDKSGNLVEEGESVALLEPASNDTNYLTYKDVRRSPRIRKKPARLTDLASSSGLKKGFFK